MMTLEEKAFYRFILIFGLISGGFFVGASQFVVGTMWPGIIIIANFFLLCFILTFLDIMRSRKEKK